MASRTYPWARSIRWQIAALSTIPILVMCAIVLVAESISFGPSSLRTDTMVVAFRIETVVDQIRAAKTATETAAVLDTVTRMGLPVIEVGSVDIGRPAVLGDAEREFGLLVLRSLPPALGAALGGDENAGKGALRIGVRIDDQRSLIFSPQYVSGVGYYLARAFTITSLLLLVSLPLLLLSLYAGRVIIAPLTDVSATIQILSPNEGPERPFEERGAHEISNLARTLNDMRSRVRGMFDDRTRMLRAISHDLRTPLTRLRLRAERSDQPALREAMLSDIAAISDLMDETLTYLSNDVSVEIPILTDVPSLIETVCSDFTDIGFSVRYEGPDRFAYACKPRGLARAVANLVDNGTKFATEVTVRLTVAKTGLVRIEVRDNGPGIPAALHQKILEPFYKMDSSRAASERGGFGLGLSIVHDVVRSHGGTLEFASIPPHGLLVVLNLPPMATSV